MGETVIWAGIKKNSDRLYLDDSFSEMGGAVGTNTTFYDRNTIELAETKTVALDDAGNIQAIYWGSFNYQHNLLMGFVQRDHLVFLVAFPCKESNVKKCAKQLQAVSENLDLNIAKWNNLTAEDIKQTNNKSSFYPKREHKILRLEHFTSWVTVHLGDSPFEFKGDSKYEAKFSYINDSNIVNLSFEYSLNALSESSEQFFLEAKPFKVSQYDKIMYFKELDENERTYVTGKIRVKEGVITVQYDFNKNDAKARFEAERLLMNMYIRTY